MEDKTMSEIQAQQGWQCPMCGRVYAPWMAQCLYCGNERLGYTYTTETNPMMHMTFEEFLDKFGMPLNRESEKDKD
jgi:ribosomal protein L37AE/L43A